MQIYRPIIFLEKMYVRCFYRKTSDHYRIARNLNKKMVIYVCVLQFCNWNITCEICVYLYCKCMVSSIAISSDLIMGQWIKCRSWGMTMLRTTELTNIYFIWISHTSTKPYKIRIGFIPVLSHPLTCLQA